MFTYFKHLLILFIYRARLLQRFVYCHKKKVPEILLVNDEIDHDNTTDMMQSEDVIDKQFYKVSTLYPFDISVNDGISKKSVTVNFDTINADNVTK